MNLPMFLEVRRHVRAIQSKLIDGTIEHHIVDTAPTLWERNEAIRECRLAFKVAEKLTVAFPGRTVQVTVCHYYNKWEWPVRFPVITVS